MDPFVVVIVVASLVSAVLAALVAMVPVVVVKVVGRRGWEYTGAVKGAFWVAFVVLVVAVASWLGFRFGWWPVLVFVAWAMGVQSFAREWAAKLLQFYDTAKAEAKL